MEENRNMCENEKNIRDKSNENVLWMKMLFTQEKQLMIHTQIALVEIHTAVRWATRTTLVDEWIEDGLSVDGWVGGSVRWVREKDGAMLVCPENSSDSSKLWSRSAEESWFEKREHRLLVDFHTIGVQQIEYLLVWARLFSTKNAHSSDLIKHFSLST